MRRMDCQTGKFVECDSVVSKGGKRGGGNGVGDWQGMKDIGMQDREQ